MTALETGDIIKTIKIIFDQMTEHSENARSDLYLSFYDDSSNFSHFSGDGKMRDYEAFEKICTEYYQSLKEQNVITIQEKFHLINPELVGLGWTGNIHAQFKNGDRMI